MNCYAQSRVLSALIILFSLTACSGETTDSLPYPVPGQTTPVDEPTIDDTVDEPAADTGNNTDITAPSTPDNIRTTNITISSISFAWDAANDDVGVTAYRVYKDGSSTAFTTTTSLSLTVTNLSAGRSYEYSVSAVDAAGNESTRSQVLSATTLIPIDSTAPTTPSALRATGITSNTVSLAWNAASDNIGVTGYKLYKNGSSSAFHTTSTLSFTDSGLNPEQSYQYRVSAIDAAGNESQRSASITVSTTATPDTSAPTTPTSLRSTTVTHEQINLMWNTASDNVGVTGYRLYKNGSNTAFATTTTPGYNDSGLTADQSYQYRVSAVDEAGNESALSSSLLVNTLAAPDTSAPTTPGNLRSTTVSSDQIDLMWNVASDNVGVTGYRLYRNGSSTAFATTTTPGYSDTGLTADQSYQYRVSAVDEAGNESPLSSTITVTTNTASVPQAVNLSWQSPTRNVDNSCLSGIDAYRLSYGTSSGNYQTSLNLRLANGDVSCEQTSYDNTCSMPIMSCSYTTEPLDSGTWYFVTQTIDLSGTVSSNSNEVSKQIN
jgi:chitodextrinase